MSRNYDEIRFTFGPDAASAAYTRDQQGEERARRARNDAEAMKAVAIAMSAAAVIGVGDKSYQHFHHSQQAKPIEQHGGHHGVSHNTQSGTGTLHTKNGDFHVSQK